ncbi:MAG: PilZ domain-containing protein, partial [Acidobacteria bacterium]|nr:PilZ domain-containing protein [Acidobacteriota bacterium]
DRATETTRTFNQGRNLPYDNNPFSPAELLAKIREVLDDRRRTAEAISQDEANKRRDRRLEMKAEVRVRQKKWETGGPDTASLVDISRRGVRFITKRSYWIGAEVMVTYPPSDPNALEQQGKVVRIEETRDGWRRVAVALNIGGSGMAEEKRSRYDRRREERRRSPNTYSGIDKRRSEERRSGLERRLARSLAFR